MKSNTIEITVTKEDDSEMDVTVEYTFIPARAGMRDTLCGVRGGGPPLEPDEPASVELGRAWETATNQPYDLSTDEEEEACEKAMEHEADEYAAQADMPDWREDR